MSLVTKPELYFQPEMKQEKTVGPGGQVPDYNLLPPYLSSQKGVTVGLQT